MNFDIDYGDLMPGFTGAVSEEEELCHECGRDEATVGNHCTDCARELEAAA